MSSAAVVMGALRDDGSLNISVIKTCSYCKRKWAGNKSDLEECLERHRKPKNRFIYTGR